MGLVNFVISTVGKCLDVAGLLLDLNFLLVHTVVRTLLAVAAFVANLPALVLSLLLQLANLALLCVVYAADIASALAHGAVSQLGDAVLGLEGLLESLKMVGYLSMHILLRGREHLCRGVVSVLEGCGIAVSLVVYFTNTVVNFALIATQNLSLAGTSAFLWSPCKLLLDVAASLLHMFVSVFVLNVYGLLLTVAVALVTTCYLNPRLGRQAAVHALVYVNSFPALRRLFRVTWRLSSALWRTPGALQRNARHLQLRLRRLSLLKRRFWRQLSRHSSPLGLVLRTLLHRDAGDRARGDGEPGEERRDPPDGRAGDGALRESRASPSSSSDGPLKASPSLGQDGKPLPTESLLTLLKEQEERKKCVICQDCTKTVVLLPCRHLCLCRDCTDILLRQPLYQQNCPLCRRMILDTMDVYL
uniref:E3 ubiquitin-protein ligase RNF26 n=1 Tax=Fundulus heteroclitus TaxID=8078 RepID=A0A3Q2U3L4_FUNHE